MILNMFRDRLSINMSEAADIEYKTIYDVFTRRLKDTARPIDKANDSDSFCSPCDGQVTHRGTLNDPETKVTIKNALENFGTIVADREYVETAVNDKDKKLYYCIIYLSPRDYHRFHSPVEFLPVKLTRVDGYLKRVTPVKGEENTEVLMTNSRVILEGRWKYGRLFYVAVGAKNVGKIFVTHSSLTNIDSPLTNLDGSLTNNLVVDGAVKNQVIAKGTEIGYFGLGSTIVLLFECPSQKTVHWRTGIDEPIKMGQPLWELDST